MAEQQGDPSEDATPYRLQEARKQGNVPKSQDLNTFAMIVVFAALLFALGSDGVRRLANLQVNLLTHAHPGEWSPEMAVGMLLGMLEDALLLLGPFMLALIVTALAVNSAQSGPVLSSKPFGPDLNRLNPVTGLKRIFSLKGLFDLFKGSIKLALLSATLYVCIEHSLPGLQYISEVDPKGYLTLLLGLVENLLVKLTAVLFILAMVDLAFVRWQYHRDLRMSKQDIKEEYKRREGDPRIRGRMRDLRRQMMKRSRSMSQVRNADVIITNPTHIAVALSYEHGVMPAPQLVAKGAGEVAKKIRDIAGRYQIPVIQNPPLARALYREVDFEAYVPEKWFPQVAKILIWVYAIRQSRDRITEE